MIAASALFGWVLMRAGMTALVTEGPLAFNTDPLVILLIVNVFLLVVGCFLDPRPSRS